MGHKKVREPSRGRHDHDATLPTPPGELEQARDLLDASLLEHAQEKVVPR
jgi:hypothetical protein